MSALLLLLLATAAAPESPPSPALLEFLGRFEDADGEWLDPLTLVEGTDSILARMPAATGAVEPADTMGAVDAPALAPEDERGSGDEEGPDDESRR